MESDLYLRIRILDLKKGIDTFNWVGNRSNILFGAELARETVNLHIKPENEGKYTILIKLKNDTENIILLNIPEQQGNLRKNLDALNDYLNEKLGLYLTEEIKRGLDNPVTFKNKKDYHEFKELKKNDCGLIDYVNSKTSIQNVPAGQKNTV